MAQLEQGSASLVELMQAASQLTGRLTQSMDRIDGTVSEVVPALSPAEVAAVAHGTDCSAYAGPTPTAARRFRL